MLSEYQYYLVDNQVYKDYDLAKKIADYNNYTIYLIETDLDNNIISKEVVE